MEARFEVDENEGYYGPLAETYDAYRPRPPAALVGLLCCLARLDRPQLVVDLGSGTGLSTEPWADRAEQVVGIEPDTRMRALAETRAPPNVRYLDGSGESTGLPDSCADIVTACCSLHWMDRETTFVEIARILRPGGAFASCDVIGRSIQPKIDAVLAAVEEAFEPFRSLNVRSAGHPERMRASGYFRFVSELTMSSEEEGNADRVVGLVLSHGQVARNLASGKWTEKGLGLRKLRRVARRVLGDRTVPFVFTYRACLAIR